MWVDIAILAVIALSIAISVARGFARDAISLAAWILAFVISISLADKFALILPKSIEEPALRLGISVTVLFLATLIMGMLANFLLTGIINLTKTQKLDRGLGAFFGFARGVVIVCILVVLGAFVSLHETGWWQQSRLIPFAEWVVQYTVPFLPESIAEFIRL